MPWLQPEVMFKFVNLCKKKVPINTNFLNFAVSIHPGSHVYVSHPSPSNHTTVDSGQVDKYPAQSRALFEFVSEKLNETFEMCDNHLTGKWEGIGRGMLGG